MSAVPYKPAHLPDDLKALVPALRNEQGAIKRALEAAWDYGEQRYLTAEPARLRAGMQVLAEGVSWDPGSGQGLYRRDSTNTSWVACFGSTSAAWTAYTPTITTGAGTITTLGTVTGRYRQDGKTLFLEAVVPITTNGTGATDLRITIPSGMTAAADATLPGTETNTGTMVHGYIASGASLLVTRTYGATYPGGSGNRIVVSGILEIA